MTRIATPDVRAREIDNEHASKLAFALEAMLVDPNGHWNFAVETLDAYKAAWEEVNPSPPTFMGEPIPADRAAIYRKMRAERDSIAKEKS